MALELSNFNVRINALVLGAVKTDMHYRLIKTMNQESIKNYSDKHILGVADLSDVIPMSIFLISDCSSQITGTSIIGDGGFLVK